MREEAEAAPEAEVVPEAAEEAPEVAPERAEEAEADPLLPSEPCFPNKVSFNRLRELGRQARPSQVALS